MFTTINYISNQIFILVIVITLELSLKVSCLPLSCWVAAIQSMINHGKGSPDKTMILGDR